MKEKNKGFSLGEVLIALGVIGIVAALSIKIMFYNVQDKQYKAQLKKTYEVLRAAHQRIIIDYGSMPKALSGCDDDEDDDCLKNILRNYLKYVDECNDGGSTFGKCHPSTVYELDGDLSTDNYGRRVSNVAGLVLSDGTLLNIDNDSKTCSDTMSSLTDKCAEIAVDLNGLSGPNKIGIDVYSFQIYKDDIKPLGSQGDGYGNTCISNNNGWGCAAHYLKGN